MTGAGPAAPTPQPTRATAGYSGTPLPQKLGIKPGARVVLVGAPGGFEHALAPLPADVHISRRFPISRRLPAKAASVDAVIVFVTERAELARRWEKLTTAAGPYGMIWVAWPKKSPPKHVERIPTDMTDNAVRDVVLPTGWVDIKVCAIDDTWSGVKTVLRVALRPAASRSRE